MGQIIFTNKAQCRDCYRCVRVCPVKAIRMENGQAHVVDERCIACGTCVRECPQEAKSYRTDYYRVKTMIQKGGLVAASVAPSLASVFSHWEQKRLPSVLRRLGFGFVAETAAGAFHVARNVAQWVENNPQASFICSACPAVVSYIEKYKPEAIPFLSPEVSPMILHAAHLRKKLGDDTQVVFIGPCAAKKGEAQRLEYDGLVAAAITFDELAQWMKEEEIDFRQLEESDFDEQPGPESRLFPLTGGFFKTAGIEPSLLSGRELSVSGFEEVDDGLRELTESNTPTLIEPLMCAGGCINGPGLPHRQTITRRRAQVLEYHHNRRQDEEVETDQWPADVKSQYTASTVHHSPVSEEEIQRILASTGKSRPQDQLNCQACGYESCRQKAVAVIEGLADPEMCLPMMRRMAEKKAEKLIESDPNGIVILDENLNIVSMNPAFRKMFFCGDAVFGKPVSYLMDASPFELVAYQQQPMFDQTRAFPNYSLTCHLKIYQLPEEKQLVGVFVDITGTTQHERQLDDLRKQTLRQAQDLLDHQVDMAQQLAQFLGQHTARGELLVKNLLQLVNDKDSAK
jgi:iron only hydrogenase large subunit-like protein